MSQELDRSRNVYLDLDDQGVVRGLQHFNAPFVSQAATPQLIGAGYLESFADLLALDAAELSKLSSSPGTHVTGDGLQLRYLFEKRNDSIVTLAYQQTVLSRNLGCGPSSVKLRRSTIGKPETEEGSPLRVGLAHSGDVALVALPVDRRDGVLDGGHGTKSADGNDGQPAE